MNLEKARLDAEKRKNKESQGQQKSMISMSQGSQLSAADSGKKKVQTKEERLRLFRQGILNKVRKLILDD